MNKDCLVGTIAATVAFAALIAGISFWVSNTNNGYYALASKCIESKGLWLPMSSGSSNGFCVRGELAQSR